MLSKNFQNNAFIEIKLNRAFRFNYFSNSGYDFLQELADKSSQNINGDIKAQYLNEIIRKLGV